MSEGEFAEKGLPAPAKVDPADLSQLGVLLREQSGWSLAVRNEQTAANISNDLKEKVETSERWIPLTLLSSWKPFIRAAWQRGEYIPSQRGQAGLWEKEQGVMAASSWAGASILKSVSLGTSPEESFIVRVPPPLRCVPKEDILLATCHILSPFHNPAGDFSQRRVCLSSFSPARLLLHLEFGSEDLFFKWKQKI